MGRQIAKCIECHFFCEVMELDEDILDYKNLFPRGYSQNTVLRTYPVENKNRELIKKTNLKDETGIVSIYKKNLTGLKRSWYCCYMGVWDEAHIVLSEKDEWKQNRDNEIKNKKRNNECFFIEYMKGMQLEGARELQKRKEEHNKYSKALKFTTIGLFIAGLGLIGNLIKDLNRFFPWPHIVILFFFILLIICILKINND